MYSEKLETDAGIISYKELEDKIEIIEYSGRDLIVSIPETINNKSIKCIKKKAFLSQRFVKEIVIPNTIEKIEDYAFARCRKLEKITLPYKDIILGQDILKDCTNLKYICNGYSISSNDDISFLLAKTLNELNAFFLFDLNNAGTDEWLNHLDATIDMRMKKDDMEDFSKMILCGEEEVVCGEDGTIEDSNPEHYKSNRVKEKIRIAFMRLLHNYKLNEDLENDLITYLLDHSKGCKTDETWQVVLDEHGDEIEYYKYLLKIGAINDSNFKETILDMGNKHTEMKSFLIKNNEENKSTTDLFSDFDL